MFKTIRLAASGAETRFRTDTQLVRGSKPWADVYVLAYAKVAVEKVQVFYEK